eukprot:3966790-Amphidinium_carterae.1
MEQEQATAKAAAIGTAKQQPQPDFRTQYKEATGKNQGAKAKPQAKPDPRTQHKEARWAVSIQQATPARRKTLRKTSISSSTSICTSRSSSNSTSNSSADCSPSSESTLTSTSFWSGISTRAITNNGQPTRTHKGPKLQDSQGHPQGERAAAHTRTSPSTYTCTSTCTSKGRTDSSPSSARTLTSTTFLSGASSRNAT